MIKSIIFLTIGFSFLYSQEPITAIPTKINVDKNKVNLGKELFFDKRLSKDETISCHSCHSFSHGGADDKRFSLGVEKKVGDINTPTVFNSVFNFAQFWNGRSKNLYEQAIGPITKDNEMGMNLQELIIKLNNTEYKNKFKKIYQDGITQNNLIDAIVEYEKTLITPNSPFDRYLKGEKDAITQEEKRGYIIFKEQGCIACHHGTNVGGNLYARFGVVDKVNSISKGRFEVTKNEDDLYYFKVASLRNVQFTSPYLHDGRFDNLSDTVKFMANYQLGKSLSEEDINSIVSFLKSLTGELYDYQEEQ
ncbi:cytochrome-c peroxidase [Aliarcobacter butzleri]|uniref:cytochrome-c peroxidase n=1 Tax=Aliarcobacter butzleri TaxID=28197 RepID=UPI0021B2F88E|nr:cytochrome c peroxidase [Aliarcobacter butzleri]MCT7567681.1 c-type cytochrome [Aliarcobacter butzleri]